MRIQNFTWRRVASAVAVVGLTAGCVTATAIPAQAGKRVLIKGESGSDFVLMARKGRNVLAAAGVKGSEYTCWVGRIYWDAQWDGWAIAMRAPNSYGGKPRWFKDTWYSVGNYKRKTWNLSRFYPSSWTSNDFRVMKYCLSEIKSAGVLPPGL